MTCHLCVLPNITMYCERGDSAEHQADQTVLCADRSQRILL
jgi:hypothetical protein